jgi:ubiquinone/menaquinone biosynthesis C-methylase UbiE
MADTSPGMLAVVRDKITASGARNVEARHVDLVKGHTLYEQYDLVCTLMTLHHIADTDEILRSFHDVLTAGGTVCISDLDKEDGTFHGEGFTGHNGFDREDLAHRLTQAGFVSPDFTTADEITKQTERGLRSFPVFLAVARKA